ncbi:MAG: FecR domain-containing protein [Bacteroidota bacterium]
MGKDRISYLYQAYLNNSLKPAELDEFQEVLLNPELNELMKEVFDDELTTLNITEHTDISQIRAAQICNEITGSNGITKQGFPFWKSASIAASILLIVSLGLYFYKTDIIVPKGQIAVVNDVAPGKNAATLTLGNGTKIRLDNAQNGKLASESGVTIRKSANGQLTYELQGKSSGTNQVNTLSTAKGETYQVRLPDGSMVWLNAATSLTYSANLIANGKRNVKLDGEAYFEVAKDRNHPFIVQSSNQTVEVLGTHFNINTYTDEPLAKTTLVEGSVKINDRILKPNEQAVLSNGEIKIRKVDVDNVVAWKDGISVFDDETLVSIMRKIERWYNVEVDFDSNIDQSELYVGGVSRNDSLSKVLESLATTGNIHFKIEGRRIRIMR